MKILMFSSDAENPRLKKYAEVLDKLEIIDMSRARGRFLRFWKGYQEAKNLLKKEKFDLITGQEIEHSFLAWRLSRKFGVPWQMQIHTDIMSPYFAKHSAANRVRVLLAKFLIPRASCVRVVSERIKRSINRDAIVLPIFSEKKTGTFDLKKKYPRHNFYLLMVGRLAREKNIFLALNAFKNIVGKNIDAILIIVGEGPEKKNIEYRIKNYGLEDRVKLEGWQEDVGGYYESADAFLLTSDYEGYNIASVEAIASALPVIMTDVGVAGEVVKNGVNGIVVPVGNKTLFSMALENFLTDSNLRARLIEGAKNTKMPYKSFEEYRDKLILSFKQC